MVNKIKKKNSSFTPIKLNLKHSSLKRSTYKKIKPFKKESYEKQKKAFNRKVLLGTALGIGAPLGIFLYNKYKKKKLNAIQN